MSNFSLKSERGIVLSLEIDGKIVYRMIEKELCNGISNVTVWRATRKHLHVKAYWVCDHEFWLPSYSSYSLYAF
jgi:hypothetical protein